MGIFNSAIFNRKVFNTGSSIVYGGGGYYTWEQARQIREEQQRLSDIEKQIKIQKENNAKLLLEKEREIAAFEQKRLSDLASKAYQAHLIQLMKQAQELENERQRLMQAWINFLREEDDILAILYCLPFMA